MLRSPQWLSRRSPPLSDTITPPPSPPPLARIFALRHSVAPAPATYLSVTLVTPWDDGVEECGISVSDVVFVHIDDSLPQSEPLCLPRAGAAHLAVAPDLCTDALLDLAASWLRRPVAEVAIAFPDVILSHMHPKHLCSELAIEGVPAVGRVALPITLVWQEDVKTFKNALKLGALAACPCCAALGVLNDGVSEAPCSCGGSC